MIQLEELEEQEHEMSLQPGNWQSASDEHVWTASTELTRPVRHTMNTRKACLP